MWRRPLVLAAAAFLLPAAASPAAACAPNPPGAGSSTVSSPAVSTAAGTAQVRARPEASSHAGVTFNTGFSLAFLHFGDSYVFVDTSGGTPRAYGVLEYWVQSPTNPNFYPVAGVEFSTGGCAGSRPPP